MSNANSPVYPTTAVHHGYAEGTSTYGTGAGPGITLREHFASLFMQSLVMYREQSIGPTYSKPELALEACHYADALLIALRETAEGVK